MIDLTIVWDFIGDWWILIGCVIAVIVYTQYQKRKKRKLLETMSRQKVSSNKPVQTKDPFKEFVAPKKKEEKKDALLSIQQLNAVMTSNTDELDRNMRVEFERLQKQLESIRARKEYIRKYGIELSRLFDKYKQNEEYLTNILLGMQNMYQKREQEQER